MTDANDSDLGLLFDVHPRPAFVFDRETLALVLVNDAACALYGWSRDELRGKTLRDLRRPDEAADLAFALAREREHTKTAFSRLSRHATKDGRVLDVNVEMVRLVFRGRACVLASITDLTSAADAERRFRMLVEHSADGIHLVDEHGMFAYLSPGAERILGVGTGTLVGRPALALVHPDDRPGIALPGAGATVINVNRARHADGSWRWTEAKTTNLVADPGIRAYVTNFRDITDRKAAELDRAEVEASLRRSEANFRSLIERLPMATVVHRGARILYVNPASLRLLRYQRDDEVVGRPLLEFVHADDRAAVAARMERIGLDGGLPPAECRMLRSDGTSVVVEAEGVRLHFDGQPANVVIGRDVTERRELLARIATADRMLSLGTLAAGVAHEINNPLTYVMSNLELLARDLPPLLDPVDRDPVLALVAEAHEGADRVRSIVLDLNALTRPANDACGPVDVVACLASSIKMAGNELRHRARIVQDFATDLPSVHANHARLGQVFVNLLVNAAHAFGEVRSDRDEVRIRVARAGEGVVVEIADTGAGMPPLIVDRIFDPFFTTKPIGVGIGLGLAIAHQIVTSIGGAIAVTSQLGEGTTFRVTLRASLGVAGDGPSAVAPASPASRILVIDDEAAVGRAVRDLLAPEHEVVPLTQPAEALARLVSGERFDVILCDLMMPEMSGMELVEQLARLAPQYCDRVVFVTGGAFTEPAQRFLETTKHGLLAKPFSEAQLREAIATARARSRGPR